ncbi:MAG TPA: VIT and VWA domain-containing protein [Pyrinomonadaceae bacterium]|nr:VIT and VWA domain-containing protein [Pyrinomonadaceae bacterium]
MKATNIRPLLLAVLMSLLFAASVAAQGVIVPGLCQHCPDRLQVPLPRSLPIKTIKIDTKIVSQVATTHIEQIFRNDTDATLEGTYFFPIPEQASITEFAIWDGDRRLVGEVRTREEARRIYDEIVRRQRDPGLLEYAGKDLFQASIFPIPPHADKKLEISYSQVLRAESGTVAYRYPLGTGRQMAQIGSVSGRIELESKDPLRNIYSPTHAIEVKRNGTGRAVVTFENQGEPQDFQLFYALSREDFGVTLLTHREPGKDGYFLLMVSPKDDWSEREYAAKDIVFVLDTSGSMADASKMEKARAALLYGIKILRPSDRFNVISFAGEEHLLANELINADEDGRNRALRFVEGLKPVGGTNIDAALTAAREQITRSSNLDHPRMIVFLTDGLPTVGTTNIEQILANAKKTDGARIFPFGVGYDVNTSLLDRLASQSGGVADYIEPKEDLEVKVSNFFSRISYPVLSDLRMDMAGVDTDLYYPRTLPDLFRGSQLTIIGRYRNPMDMNFVRLTLTGKSGGNERKFYYNNLHFALTEEANDFLPRLWATRRVGWLMEQVRTNGEQKELRDEIVDLGTRYGIVTPYTSYLAVENESALGFTSATIARNKIGNARGGSNAPPPPPSVADARAVTGTVAVQQSKKAREQQEMLRLDKDEPSSAIRTAGGKTFYLRDGIWTDADFKAGMTLPQTVVKFGSDQYFALLKQKPRLATFFSLGEKVVVILDGTIYRVDAAGN